MLIVIGWCWLVKSAKEKKSVSLSWRGGDMVSDFSDHVLKVVGE